MTVIDPGQVTIPDSVMRAFEADPRWIAARADLVSDHPGLMVDEAAAIRFKAVWRAHAIEVEYMTRYLDGADA